MLGRKGWLLKIYILGKNQKSILKNFSPWNIFVNTGHTEAHLNDRHGQKHSTSLQQKIRIKEMMEKISSPISFQIFTTFNNLHQKTPTRGLENVNELNNNTGRWRFTAVCCATHPKAVFESPVGSNKKKLCGMGSGKKTRTSQRKPMAKHLSQH